MKTRAFADAIAECYMASKIESVEPQQGHASTPLWGHERQISDMYKKFKSRGDRPTGPCLSEEKLDSLWRKSWSTASARWPNSVSSDDFLDFFRHAVPESRKWQPAITWSKYQRDCEEALARLRPFASFMPENDSDRSSFEDRIFEYYGFFSQRILDACRDEPNKRSVTIRGLMTLLAGAREEHVMMPMPRSQDAFEAGQLIPLEQWPMGPGLDEGEAYPHVFFVCTEIRHWLLNCGATHVRISAIVAPGDVRPSEIESVQDTSCPERTRDVRCSDIELCCNLPPPEKRHLLILQRLDMAARMPAASQSY